MKTFEQFLEETIASQVNCYDDGMPDYVANIISLLDEDEYWEYIEEYGIYAKMEAKKWVSNNTSIL